MRFLLHHLLCNQIQSIKKCILNTTGYFNTGVYGGFGCSLKWPIRVQHLHVGFIFQTWRLLLGGECAIKLGILQSVVLPLHTHTTTSDLRLHIGKIWVASK